MGKSSKRRLQESCWCIAIALILTTIVYAEETEPESSVELYWSSIRKIADENFTLWDLSPSVTTGYNFGNENGGYTGFKGTVISLNFKLPFFNTEDRIKKAEAKQKFLDESSKEIAELEEAVLEVELTKEKIKYLRAFVPEGGLKAVNDLFDAQSKLMSANQKVLHQHRVLQSRIINFSK